jgi:hypothetical protein
VSSVGYRQTGDGVGASGVMAKLRRLPDIGQISVWYLEMWTSLFCSS